jgi:hypothetical protein
MSHTGAEIIAFPGRHRNQPSADVRLSAARAELLAALAGQRDAIAAWRGSIDALGGATRSIQDNLGRYRSRLGTLQTGLVELHQQSTRLRDWADANSRPAPG